MGNIKIIQVPISDLTPAEYNPRKISPQDRNQLTKSIKKFGLVDPIIVNQHKGRENIIIGGHQRFYIAQELEYPTIPCVFVDLEIEQEKELNLRLNKNTGEWDYELLQEFDVKLLEDVGFDDIETMETEILFSPESENSTPSFMNSISKKDTVFYINKCMGVINKEIAGKFIKYLGLAEDEENKNGIIFEKHCKEALRGRG